MSYAFSGETQVSGSDVLDHIGLVAATIDKLGLVRKVDELIPVTAGKGAKLTHGQRVAAMIMNGLGFINDRLYMFPKFLANKPVAKLFGQGIKAEDFNDDGLGRSLDKIHAYGETKLYSDIALKVGIEHDLLGRSHHVDTTSLTVYGEYAEEDAPPDPGGAVKPEYGHAKNKRFDLKQMTLLLATTGKSNFPLWMEAHSGNTSDKISLQEATERMQKFFKGLKDAPAFLYVGDSAMYSNCVAKSSDLLWLSRVPENIKDCRELIQLVSVPWVELDNGYKIHLREVNRGGVRQRWCLVYSQAAYDKEIQTLEKNIAKETTTATLELWHLSNQLFGCSQGIHSAITKFKKTLRYHQVSYQINEVAKHQGRGRPKKDTKPTTLSYQLVGQLEIDQLAVTRAKLGKGRFVLATNQLDTKALPDEKMLPEYKAQSGCETGFKFIKDDTFEVDSIFLKKPERISALMAVMTLCLMVYGYAQFFLRQQLLANNDTVESQTGKQTNKPSMQWIYRMFHGVSVLKLTNNGITQTIVLNLTDSLRKVINYFGPLAQQFYGIVEAAA